MKGLVFRLLENMVVDRLGLQAWDTLVAQTELRTRGGFIGSETYPDEDLIALVRTASRLTGRPVDELLRSFGRYVFPDLVGWYVTIVAEREGAKSFLMSVDRSIHLEVRKLHVGAVVPEFTYEDLEPNRLVMIYRSERRLCDLAEGLIEGVGDHFGEDIRQEQTRCTKRGHDHCRFELFFAGRRP